MSGIVGIYNLDGRPVDFVLLNRMTNATSHRGPDGVGHWRYGPIGLGHRMLYTTPESLHEKQPLVSEAGDLCLTLDGRVDNREELRAALKAKGVRLRIDTDAEIILRAYECWGEKCLKRLIGDFAFAIWDGRNRHLFCARDILGMKPFYYYADDRVFIWCSELRPLFEHEAVPCQPNEGMVGEYLASAITNKEETLFRSIFRLPPAHFLVVQPDRRLHKERYWDIDTAKEIHYRTDKEYAEHFSEIFKEAVRCRLRSHKPVGAYLSGGLDSSSVVGMAQSLYRDGAVADTGFETFSLVFPGQSCDESTYIEDVVQFWGIKSNALCPQPPDRFWHADQVNRYYDIPDYPNGSMSDSLAILAQQNGFRVLLTGVGGDEWFSGSRYHYADLLRKLRIRSLIRKARSDSTVPSMLSLPSHPILTWGLRPLIPRTIRRLVKGMRRCNGVPDWMELQYSKRIHLPERLNTVTDWSGFSSYAQGDHYMSSTSGWQTHSIEMEERSASEFTTELRHPFHDRRVIEFSLALPEEQRWRGDQRKFILRQSLRGHLPSSVSQRITKAEFSSVFVKALRDQGGERFFDSLSIASKRWIDQKQVRSMYRQMEQMFASGDKAYLRFVWPLWNIFGIEMWFDTVFGSRKGSQLNNPYAMQKSLAGYPPPKRRAAK